MKFTLSWLKDHLDTDASLDEITDKLTAIGLELEGLEDRAATFAPFKVAKIESTEKHPDADRLKLCIVDTGEGKIQVVCGAPNARAGMKGVFAPAGSYIPGLDVTLKKGVIRGQESNGMMVSEREMGLSDDHEGIIDVTDRDPDLGTPFAELYGLDDPVIEIGLTPNRSDCTGVRGIARDLAAAGIGTLKDLDTSPVKGGFASPVGVKIENEESCPLFIGRYIRGVKNGPSPDWMQQRLKAIGLRPISALVDITNYMSYCLGRPLHVFDADKLKGDITVRLARKGETLDALNDKNYELDDFMTAICDESGVIGLGGVIGGEPTGCTDETVNVFLEVAYFDPMRIAKTGRALQIVSDARYRFERGVDPDFVVPATEIATRMIMDLCGGEPGEVVQAGSVPDTGRDIAFDPAYTEKLAGFNIPAAEQKAILETLGFTFKDDRTVQPPSWRGDIEGRADLVEEVVRIHGYHNMPAVSLPKISSVTHSAETPSLTRARLARSTLAGRGMNECVTWSFMGAEFAEMFGTNERQNAATLKIMNPINATLDQMRPSILPNLIEATGKNRDKGFPDSALFEVGPVFLSNKPDGQALIAAGVRSGHKGGKHWSGEEASRKVDAFDVKADAIAALAACGAPVQNLLVTRDAPDWYHPGRSAALRLGANVLAYFGELHPAVQAQMDIRETICVFEVFLDNIPQPKKKGGTAKKLLTLSPLQPVERDFAFIVDDAVDAESLVRAAMGADKNLVSRVDIFDVYQGKGVDPGKKSIAINVVLQPGEQTLTDAELESVTGKIVNMIAEKTGGQLRG
ncbi:MAG: phenylalanine--tRNA ligase subunit beta [Rhodospirillales bacterium]|nr:phenylalanine--tRNA ligase subunit beta [Rhodospirillales bacterium]MCB9997307.1 phenylalanine--tRNA ligase subunit beta [Rhodospirillales bacterium]